jgi:long-chain acyl-CoA synthetase
MASETTAVASADATAPRGVRTIARLWQDAVARGREGPAYLVEDETGWREITLAEAARSVDELANGLLSLGVRKGDTFAILARTRIEWTLFDFALALVGGIAAAIYPNCTEKEASYIAQHSDSVGALVEDDEQRAKLAGVQLEHLLAFADLDDLRERGRAYAAEHPSALEEASSAVDEEDTFTYIYTSGTTGPPKACMIRHRNYYAMTDEVAAVPDFLISDDVMLLYLPLAHNFGRFLHLLGPRLGYTIAFCPDPYRVGDVLPAVRPTVFPSVPRIFEKVHTSVTAKFAEASGVKRTLIDWALRVGHRASELRREGRALPPGLAAQLRIADRLVYSKVKDRLGGRLRIGVSGGAPLAKEISEFFHALGILIIEGYGLTECTTAASVNRVTRFRFGTVGPALPGVELRVAEDGEILIRSETVFAGYYKDQDATREVLGDDGWLRSGDIGEIDEDGFLRITDRKKDIIVTAGGKNVAPQNIENLVKMSPLVSQALVIGDRRRFVAALITLDEAAQGLDAGAARERVQQVVDSVNGELSRFEQIKRFAILPRDFSADEGEVTPTLKLKRRVCEQHFAAEIEALYT